MPALFRAGLFRWGTYVGVLPSVHCEPWEAIQGQNSGCLLAHVACVGTPWGFPNTQHKTLPALQGLRETAP